jgi:hypothetical protein
MIHILDSDVISPLKFEMRMAKIKSHPLLVVVSCTTLLDF